VFVGKNGHGLIILPRLLEMSLRAW
jgi:hypothetical protein